jgi:predicted helicase
MNFTQTDLVSEDVMMLDAYDSIFLWIGKDSNKNERDKAIEMAIEYLKTGNYITCRNQPEHSWFSLFLGLFNYGLSTVIIN